MRRFFCLLIILSGTLFTYAQDTLPNFNVKNLGNDADGNPRVIVSWVNTYDSLSQLSIQTSHDSLKNYRTLISITDPNARLNGFADTKAANDHMFYRLFIAKPGGGFFFTAAKKPMLDTSKVLAIGVNREQPVIKRFDVIAKKLDFVPSFYVYTNKDGYVFINLPDADKQKYHVKFFEEDGSFLFDLKNIKQTGLTLDKTNFVHAGWFSFELYNDERLVEKSKFYLAKEF